jgi:hypothetical protein
MSSPPPPPPGEGLGSSTPLVTVAGGPPSLKSASGARSGSQQQNLSPTSGNHPLAPAAPPQGGLPHVQASDAVQSVEVSFPGGSASSQVGTPTMVSMPPPPTTTTTAAVTPPRRPPPPPPPADLQAFPDPPPPAAPPHQFTTPPSASSATVGPTKGVSNFSSPVQSLDDLVDAFLSGPSYRTQQMLPPLLRPPALINEDPLQCLRTLVERRAWGDVLQISADLLRGPESLHASIYKSMLQSSGDADTNDNNGDHAARLREETAEILALQCHAWLKLRRYSDLGQEIERWNFLAFNDNYSSSEAPSWVPWSLRKSFSLSMLG